MTTNKNDHNNILVIEEFVRTRIPALICLTGFSGCGKTKSAIKIAKGIMKVIGGKTLFLDTENGRGKVYAKDAEGSDFKYSEFSPPFTPERYMAAIKQAEKLGFDHLVLDSGSHEWDGLGGMLDIADNNTYSNGSKKKGLGKWDVKSRHKTFMNNMLAGRMNIIICLRAKDKFIEILDSDGKKVIIKDGFVPLQERNFKYDMMIQLPMPENGEGRYLMDRERGFKCPGELLGAFKEGQQINEETGKFIGEWINSGISPDELLRQLKSDAMIEAEQGVEHFRKYWKSLPQDQKLKLTPFLANFESVAKTADIEKEDEESPLPITRNIGGSDISSLMASSVKSLPKEPEKNEEDSVLMIRNEEHRDIWSIVDQVHLDLLACKDMNDYNSFFSLHVKNLASINQAPKEIADYWNAQVVKWQRGIAAKAA